MNPLRSRLRRSARKLASHLGMAALIALALVFLFGVWNTMSAPDLTIAIPRGVEGAALKRVIQRFSETEYNGAVEVIELPYEELWRAQSSFMAKGRADNIPQSVAGFDVMLVDDPWMPALLDSRNRNKFAPIRPQAGDEDFIPTTLDVCRHRGQLYGLPFVGNSQLFCYRTDSIGKEARASWQRLAALGKTSGRLSRYVARLAPGNSIVSDSIPILWEFAPDTLYGSVLTEKAVPAEGALDLLRELAGTGSLRHGAAGLSATDFDLAVYMVGSGAQSSIIWSAWAMTIANAVSLKPRLKEELEFDLPPGKPALGTWLLMVVSGRAATRQGLEFVRFATSKEQIRQAGLEGNPPSRRSVFLDPDYQRKYWFHKTQLASLEQARLRVRTPRWRLLEAQVGTCLWEVASGLVSPKDALGSVKLVIDRLKADSVK